jgi:hypothetical protein
VLIVSHLAKLPLPLLALLVRVDTLARLAYQVAVKMLHLRLLTSLELPEHAHEMRYHPCPTTMLVHLAIAMRTKNRIDLPERQVPEFVRLQAGACRLVQELVPVVRLYAFGIASG